MSTTPRRVLMAWEHGRNLGHVARLTALAGRFQQMGAGILWALPPGWPAAEPFKRSPQSSVLAPQVVLPHTAPPSAAQSFADVLASFGFLEVDALTQAVRRWRDLFDKWAVDHVMLDYAPAAQLAALLHGLPAWQITNGFDTPPPECPLFGLGMRGPMLERRNQVRVSQLNQSLGAVAEAVGSPGAAVTLAALLAYPTRWYDCIQETDPYGPREDGLYLGPIGQPAAADAVPWPDLISDLPQ